MDEEFPPTTRDLSVPPSLIRKDPDVKSRLTSFKNMENNLFAKNELSGSDPKDIKASIESEIKNYAKNQEIYENYKATLVDNILKSVRLLAGNDEISNTQLLDYKDTLMSENEEVFLKNEEFKRFINDIFNFYSTPENLGTGENTREGLFNSTEYKIEGGSKVRKTKQKKRRRCKRKTRKHRK